MSGKGNCYDIYAAIETFFKTIKAELIWRRSWPTRRAAEIHTRVALRNRFNALGTAAVIRVA